MAAIFLVPLTIYIYIYIYLYIYIYIYINHIYIEWYFWYKKAHLLTELSVEEDARNLHMSRVKSYGPAAQVAASGDKAAGEIPKMVQAEGIFRLSLHQNNGTNMRYILVLDMLPHHPPIFPVHKSF